MGAVGHTDAGLVSFESHEGALFNRYDMVMIGSCRPQRALNMSHLKRRGVDRTQNEQNADSVHSVDKRSVLLLFLLLLIAIVYVLSVADAGVKILSIEMTGCTISLPARLLDVF